MRRALWLAFELVVATAGAYIALVGLEAIAAWWAFRVLGNRDELSPAHRQLLDGGEW